MQINRVVKSHRVKTANETENWAWPSRAEVGLRSLVCCLCAAGANNKFELTGRYEKVGRFLRKWRTKRWRGRGRLEDRWEREGIEEERRRREQLNQRRTVQEAFRISRAFFSLWTARWDSKSGKALKNMVVDDRHERKQSRDARETVAAGYFVPGTYTV